MIARRGLCSKATIECIGHLWTNATVTEHQDYGISPNSILGEDGQSLNGFREQCSNLPGT